MADKSHGDRLQNNNTSIDRRANIAVANNIFGFYFDLNEKWDFQC